MRIGFILTFLLFIGCGMSGHYVIEHETPTTTIITGTFDRTILRSDEMCKTWYDQFYTQYTVDAEKTAEIGALQNDIRYVVIAGTWCSDSKRELPRMYKIFDAAKISDKNITLIGVDRSKKNEFADIGPYDIRLVPTIIVLRREKEIGRIIESPVETLEEDLLEILKR